MSDGRTAFVTGGTGFLGRHLVEQLTAAQWRVVVFHRAGSDLSSLASYGIEPTEGVLHETNSVAAAMPQDVDTVFHVAGDTTFWPKRYPQQTRTNVAGTQAVVAAALRRGARRMVHTSTWNTFDLNERLITESTRRVSHYTPINYDRTKLLAEEAVLKGVEQGLQAVILNPCHIMGRYDTHNWVSLIHAVSAGKLPGGLPGGGSFCHAPAVAAAHIAAVDRGRVGENYLLGGADASFMEVLRDIGDMLDKRVPKRPLPLWLLGWVARIKTGASAVSGREPDITPHSLAAFSHFPRAQSDKAINELGYDCAPLQDMLRDTIDWLRREGRL